MAEIKRDIFPPNIMQRIQTPIQGRTIVGNLAVTRNRPSGGILYPESQQSSNKSRKGQNG